MISSASDRFHIYHASNITCVFSFLHCKVILEGVAKGTKAGGGAVTLESTEIERKREDWQGRVSALVLPFCGCFLSSLLG